MGGSRCPCACVFGGACVSLRLPFAGPGRCTVRRDRAHRGDAGRPDRVHPRQGVRAGGRCPPSPHAPALPNVSMCEAAAALDPPVQQNATRDAAVDSLEAKMGKADFKPPPTPPFAPTPLHPYTPLPLPHRPHQHPHHDQPDA